MINYKTELKPIQVPEDVICDMCEKSCWAGTDNPRTYQFLSLDVRWGYGSSRDGDRISAQVCQNCVDTKLMPIIKFEIDPMYGEKTSGRN